MEERDLGRAGRPSDPGSRLRDFYRPIEDDLAKAEVLFDSAATTDLPFVNGLCHTVRSYRGKRLRPALLLLAGKAAGAISPDHRLLAAVVEMVHVATLIHDDVLDEADERRAQPTVRSCFGNVAAVLLGDYFISHAFHLCSDLDSQYARRLIGATTNTVCEGEMLQNHHRGNAHLSEAMYLDIIRQKTGTLTATACELGAYCAGADPGVISALRSYGMSAGVAFQIIDDILDVAGDRIAVGKTLGRDLLMGKLTLPAIHCLKKSGPATSAAMTATLKGEAMPTAEQVHTWLNGTGSIAYALGIANKFVADALHELDILPASEARTSLASLAEFITQRRF